MAVYRMTINPFTAKRGDEIKLVGVEGRGRLVSACETSGVVVIAFAGYTYNPGSRHSMVRSYTPAETAVFQRMDVQSRQVFQELHRWETRPTKD